MIKQMLEETKAGQAGAGYDKLESSHDSKYGVSHANDFIAFSQCGKTCYCGLASSQRKRHAEIYSNVRGYSLTKRDEFTRNHGANIEKFVNDLKSARWMTSEKKSELEAFYANLKTSGASAAALKRSQVHPKDLNLIRASMPELDTVMAEIVKVEWDEAIGNIGKPKPNNTTPSSKPAPLPHHQEFGDAKHRDALIQIMGSVDSPRSIARKVTVLSESGGRVAWSPKGDRILIDQKGSDGYYDLYVIRPDGTKLVAYIQLNLITQEGPIVLIDF